MALFDPNFATVREVLSMPEEEYVALSLDAMRARFSNFVLTPEQILAWKTGFHWTHDAIQGLRDRSAESWIVAPEFVAPLISGRPDLVIVSSTALVVIEMKTGETGRREPDKRQALNYSVDLWGKLKAARERRIVPVLLTRKGSATEPIEFSSLAESALPVKVADVNVKGLSAILVRLATVEESLSLDAKGFLLEIKYSPRPSVVEAATSLVAKLEDANVVTGLSASHEIDRVIEELLHLAREAQNLSRKQIAIVNGSPGAGKTLVGLRIAHEQSLQKNLEGPLGTPLYLTGNAPLVEVLVESLARDETRRTSEPLAVTRKNADAKVKLVHSVVGKKLGIESNVIVFDEGQRIWTETRMQSKKGDLTLGSEAFEIITALDAHPWALLIVLIGEGQEINKGEEGVLTWLDAVTQINNAKPKNWELVMPRIADLTHKPEWLTFSDALTLRANVRTDNAANVSEWVGALLDGKIERAASIRKTMADFPLFVTRDLDTAKSWIRKNVEQHGGTSGVLASSRSKRLFHYGVDVGAEPNRNINWANWYLNTLPDLNSGAALEIAATEFKCQGLELDWSLVCWSWDLQISHGQWSAKKLRAADGIWWQTKAKAEIQFQLNSYRVLLTRSRRGMVIWVPEGFPSSKSMPNDAMDAIARTLLFCGAVQL